MSQSAVVYLGTQEWFLRIGFVFWWKHEQANLGQYSKRGIPSVLQRIRKTVSYVIGVNEK